MADSKSDIGRVQYQVNSFLNPELLVIYRQPRFIRLARKDCKMYRENLNIDIHIYVKSQRDKEK